MVVASFVFVACHEKSWQRQHRQMQWLINYDMPDNLLEYLQLGLHSVLNLKFHFLIETNQLVEQNKCQIA